MSATDTGQFQRPAPTAPPPSTDRTTSGTSEGRGFSIAAIVLGALAVFVAPIILGPIGLVLGYVGHTKGDWLARTAMIVAGVGMVLGFVLGFVAFTQLGMPGGG